MYHFTIIDEASTEIEQESSPMQENALEQASGQPEEKSTLVRITSQFLHYYLDQLNRVRTFLNKD